MTLRLIPLICDDAVSAGHQHLLGPCPQSARPGRPPIAEIGEDLICTSIIVAAELRYGAAKRASSRLSEQLESVLGAVDVLALEPPVDVVYGELRARLERNGQPIGANDMLIAAHALALGHTIVTDNEREFARVENLPLENWLR
jgi:tRNA(fMet)-specific endonuclease VapC